jgi:hypothetical protein
MKHFSAIVFLFLLAYLAQSEAQCRRSGRWANRDSPDCTTYWKCILVRGCCKMVLAKCPEYMKYHWGMNRCVPNTMFVCPNGAAKGDGDDNKPDVDEPVDPLEPENSINPEPEIQPIRPILPPVPIQPIHPIQPEHPIEPTNPSLPIHPIQPILPPVPIQPIQPLQEFICPGPGNFPNEESYDCQLFHSCNGYGEKPDQITCGKRTIFSWQARRCVSSETTGCPATAPRYVCQGVGSFIDRAARDCSKYFACFVNYDGRMRHVLNSCPVGKAFDIRSRECLPSDQVLCAREL